MAMFDYQRVPPNGHQKPREMNINHHKPSNVGVSHAQTDPTIKLGLEKNPMKHHETILLEPLQNRAEHGCDFIGLSGGQNHDQPRNESTVELLQETQQSY